MLAVAREKNVYAALHNLALGGPLPFEDGRFAGVISAGVFTTGHVGTEGLGELLRICRPGGVIVLTVKDALWTTGFAAHVAALEESGQAALIEQTDPYRSMPRETATSPSRGLVLRVPAND
jgi:SAM-dependent methyltransferase